MDSSHLCCAKNQTHLSNASVGHIVVQQAVKQKRISVQNFKKSLESKLESIWLV